MTLIEMKWEKLFQYTQYQNIRNNTDIFENLSNAILGFFGLRNEFVNVQGNKKRQ